MPYIQNGSHNNYLQIFAELADISLIPLFVFISGLMLNKDAYQLPFQNFCKKRLLHVLLLYLLGIFFIMPVTNYYAGDNPQGFVSYFESYLLLSSSPGPLWILPVIVILDILFFYILNQYKLKNFIKKLEELEKTKIFIFVFLVLFFSYMIPYAIVKEQTFLSFPIEQQQWFALGPIWLPKTKVLLLFFLYFFGVVITNSNKLFKYSLSTKNKLSETYIYKIIESIILYILFSTLNEKNNMQSQSVAEFLHALLFLLLMISLSMSVIGIFNKLCAKKSQLVAYFSKYNYFIYSINILPVMILQKTLIKYHQLQTTQKIYTITLFSITISYALGLIIRRIPFICKLIPSNKV